jgi:hypothetical protein
MIEKNVIYKSKVSYAKIWNLPKISFAYCGDWILRFRITKYVHRLKNCFRIIWAIGYGQNGETDQFWAKVQNVPGRS